MSQKNKHRSAGVKLIVLAIILLIISFIPAFEAYGPMIFLAAAIVAIIGIVVAILDAIHNHRMRKQGSAFSPQQPSDMPAPAAPISVEPIQPSPPQKPYRPPQEHHGAYLSYSYDDVQIDTSVSDLNAIKRVPANTVLSFKRLDDQQLEIYSGETLIGAMFDNKLRSMANDFLRDPDRSAMAVLLSNDPVVIGMYFYNSGASFVRKLERNADSKVFKLVSNGNAEMQDNIAQCNEGYPIEVDFDYNKEKYLVSSGPYELGYMPAGFSKYIGEHEEVEGRIYEIEEPDDNDKYSISVIVVPAQ